MVFFFIMLMLISTPICHVHDDYSVLKVILGMLAKFSTFKKCFDHNLVMLTIACFNISRMNSTVTVCCALTAYLGLLKVILYSI